MAKLVTFGFVGDEIQELRNSNSSSYKMLKKCAKIACNFWNGHINPSKNVVIQIGAFNDRNTTTIARAWTPFEENGVLYSKVEFNIIRLFRETFVATVMIHEICHSLGFGWEPLVKLFDKETGMFYPEYVQQVPELADMRIELDYGPSTQYSHWDEEQFGDELMTGFKRLSEDYLLPVTIKIMKLFGHEVVTFPEERMKLNDKVIRKLSKIKFSRQKDVSLIDTLYERETTVAEEHGFEVSWFDKLVNLFK
jgi:hypothetical protein